MLLPLAILTCSTLSAGLPQDPAPAPMPAPMPAPVAAPAAVPVGIAARYPLDRGITKDPAVRFASGFEQGLRDWTVRHHGIFTLADDAKFAHADGARAGDGDARQGPGRRARVRAAEGRGPAVPALLLPVCSGHLLAAPLREVAGAGPGLRGDAGKAPAGDQGFWTGIEPLRGRWRFYTYWHQMRGWNNPGSVPGTNDDGTETTAENDYYGNSFTPEGQELVPKDSNT